MKHDLYILDMETQRDFLLPGGSCYTHAADPVLRNIQRLFHWAQVAGVPVISTVLRVRPFEHGPLAERPHCVENTPGELKVPQAVLPARIDLGMLNSTDLLPDIFGKYQQVIIERRQMDIFAHARLERLITELGRCSFVICGAGRAGAFSAAAVGLRSRGFGVILARDAVLDVGDTDSEMAWRRMDAKGVVFATTQEIVAPRPARTARPLRRETHAHRK